MNDLLDGGHAGESPYRYGLGLRCSLSAGYPCDPLRDYLYPWRLAPRDRCVWSLEIVRRQARDAERDRRIFAAIAAAEARLEAMALYRAQRRQAIVAIAGGLAIVVLVIATAILF